MIYTYVSSKQIISKVFRDLRIGEADWVIDGIEWIGEALDAIGASIAIANNVEVVKTYSHKAALPSNFIQLIEVRYGENNSNKEDIPVYEDFPYVLPYNSGFTRAHLETANTATGVQVYKDEDFFIEAGYITTSFEEDWVCIVYKGIQLDEDSFPMVPDNFSFSQAMYWYIVMKLLEGGRTHPAGIPWNVAEERWLKYCTQARSKAKMPDISKNTEFLKNWLQLLPNYSYDSLAQNHMEDNTVTPQQVLDLNNR